MKTGEKKVNTALKFGTGFEDMLKNMRNKNW